MAEPAAKSIDVQRLRPEMASRRLLVLAFVREYIATWGDSPSQREIAAGVGISRARARELIRALVRSGQLLRRAGSRGLELPGRRDEAIRLLRALGEVELGDIGRPCPKSTLLHLPPLTYPSGHGGCEIETGAGAREGVHSGGGAAPEP